MHINESFITDLKISLFILLEGKILVNKNLYNHDKQTLLTFLNKFSFPALENLLNMKYRELHHILPEPGQKGTIKLVRVEN